MRVVTWTCPLPDSFSSSRSESLQPITAHLDAVYTLIFGTDRVPDADATFRIRAGVRRAIMCGRKARVTCMGATALTCMTAAMSASGSWSQKYLPRTMPALLIRTSGTPISAVTRPAAAATSGTEPTSRAKVWTALLPRARSSAAAASRAPALRSQRTTCAAPSRTARSAYSRPMPMAAPVMRTVRPETEMPMLIRPFAADCCVRPLVLPVK